MGVYYACDENDSEYLEHFGILGMKWGVRRFQNSDGSLTAEGRERYYGSKETKKFADMIKNADVHSSQLSRKYFDAARVMNSPQLKNVAVQVHGKHRDLVKNNKESSKIEDDFYKSPDYEKYVRKVAKESYDKNKDSWYKGSTFEEILNLYKYDDFDQGYSFRLWLKESKSPEAKRYKELEKERYNLYKEIHEMSKSALEDFLGDYKDETIGAGKTTVTSKAIHYLNDNLLYAWDTFEDDFPPGSVPVEVLMRLAI